MGLDKNDIKALIAILQKGLVDENEEDTDIDTLEEVVAKPKTKAKKNPVSKTTKKRFNNKFDNMPEVNMFKEDVEIDRKLQKFPPTPRTRKFAPIKVQCRVCGKKDKVPPTLVESIDRYKCNRCATGAG